MAKLKSNLEKPIVIRKKMPKTPEQLAIEWLKKRKKRKEAEALDRMYKRQQGKRSR